ncbi:hypothetical protein WN943_020296 [Citrus x changshan-huyou]
MGNCVSSHKSTDMKLTVQIQSPIKENKTVKTDQHMAAGAGQSFLPQTSAMGQADSFRDLSNTEEAFLDSHPWLDSDCEDYFSVNGDLTPSRGSTPVHEKSFIGDPAPQPQLDKIPHTDSVPDSISKPSPTLFELFRESFGDNPANGNQNLHGHNEAIPTISPPKSTRNPFTGSSETTPYRVSLDRKENSIQSAQCCIPSFMRSRSFSERKKRLSSANTDGR